MKQNKKLIPALAANLLIPALVIAAWLWSSLTPPEPGTLQGNWFTSLRFYTNLSNLFAGITALCYALGLLRILRGRAQAVCAAVQTLALVGTAAIMLTFLTVAIFLAPAAPQLHLFGKSGFLFHLLIPVLCIAVYVLLDGFGTPCRFAWLLGALPMLLYGVCYTANCLINGYESEWTPESNDWYGFLVNGLPAGIVSFLVMALMTVGAGVLLHWGNRRLARRASGLRKS